MQEMSEAMPIMLPVEALTYYKMHKSAEEFIPDFETKI